ncbi:sulfite exporter TauE/SafE family protein [Vibrio nigripulchritudo]|uniref:sulfite exporter TauE/SafE family protein n=1 Tax=Vibrio nigripulchritudo TaxID=28173 RepID=UPI0005FA65FA|nr:sulfite exporter TauE/SafE family protein [Vibrio nigripulchritudo]
METTYILGVTSFFTSAVAGVFGFGGGLLLISILPAFLAPHLIIPVHGVTQLASNVSRMYFSWSSVRWDFLPKFIAGTLLGVIVFGFLIVSMPTEYIPLAIGIYILLNIWSKRFSTFIGQYESYYVVGFLQSGLGLVVGATGPLALSVLTKDLEDKNQIIATSALFMTISHLSKIVVFGVIGFSLTGNLSLLTVMVICSVLGSFIGTQLRRTANNEKWIYAIKALLTIMAIKMIATALM